jgi:nucleoside-diphosphate-sugar epimerase
MLQVQTDGPISLVTGATGLLGSHVTERLVARGDRVRALVRPTSDTRFLRRLGVDLVEGDLTDLASCRRAMERVRVVYHSAAKVGDWGRWPEFQTGCLDATETLAGAAAEACVERFVHISSTSAYGHPKEGGPPVDESAPLGQNLWPVWDYYTRSKVECEHILWRMADRDGLRLSVIRPSWLYGERDRTTTARIVRRISAGKVPLIGHGDNPLSAIYAGNVADAAILAADDAGSVGEAYNVTSMGPITQREWFDLFADACEAPRPSRHVPYGATFAVATGIEAVFRLIRRRRPPVITRYATWLMGRDLSYSTAKAETKLGWRPAVGYRESIERTVRWYLDATEPAPITGPAEPLRSSSS